MGIIEATTAVSACVCVIALPTVRTMRQTDLSAVLDIERESYDFPWSKGIFGDCLKSGYHCLLAISDPHQAPNQADDSVNDRAPDETGDQLGSESGCSEILGYAILMIAADEGHILNLCVAERWRRHGIARLLLEHMLKITTVQQTREVFLEVRPSNPAAIKLYLSTGFNEIGVRRDYYKSVGGREDAIVLARSNA